MNYSVILHGKLIKVTLTQRAEQALDKRAKPITAVVHLIFGCMVAKRVWFPEEVDVEVMPVTDKLDLNFDVVRYTNCSPKNIDGGAEPGTFPLGRDISDFVPDLLKIDYLKQKYTGDFTYQHISPAFSNAEDELLDSGTASPAK